MFDLLQILEGLRDLLPALETLLVAICWIIGVILAIYAVILAAKRSEGAAGGASWARPITAFTIGICFVAFPETIQVMLMTFFGAPERSPAEDIFRHAEVTLGRVDEGAARRAVVAITSIIQFVGLIGFVRGLLLLNAAARGHGAPTIGPGLTFLIAGTAAINFPAFMGLVESLVSA